MHLCRINPFHSHWAQAQGPAPRGAPHLEDASQNNQKKKKLREDKREKEEKKGKENKEQRNQMVYKTNS